MRLVFFLGLPGLWARVQDRLRDLPWGGFRTTASSPGHRYPVEALLVRRDRLLRERVMYFALAFGLLTPLWILMDVWGFPKSLWPQMMWLRLLTSVAFLFLFVHAARGLECRNVGRSYGEGCWLVVLLLAIPAGFYLGSQWILSGFEPVAQQASLVQAYIFLPFVMMAGLALFPLKFAEATGLAVLVMFLQLLVLLFRGGIWLPALPGILWLLLLIGAVSVVASFWQLRLMVALTQQLCHDPLTACLSRRSLEEMLEHHFALAVRSHSALSVAFLDLDDFKAVNDQFGHEAGDQMLAQVGCMLHTHLRRSALVGRWGGEEFLLIFPGADRGEAFQALSRIQQEGLGVRPDGRRLTASIGLAERRQDRARDWNSLVELADTRMYIAKSGGRDRVVVA